MKLKPLLIVFAVLSVTALLIYSNVLLGARHAEQSREQTEELKTATVYENSGVVTIKDYLELRQVRNRVKASHSLSDTDFDWLTQLFDKPTLKDTPAAAVNKRVWAFGPMLDAELTPNQKEKMYNLAVPMLSSTDKAADDADKVYGCNAMRKFRDKRSIPMILPLLNAPRPMVHKRSQQALDSMGYKAS